ncbi:hypothetical protein A2U01_0062199, partial [Trifolium medium]|nr:hypothetical protein [Trifolium medium]
NRRRRRTKSVLITAWIKDHEARVEEFGEPVAWIKVERSGSPAGIEKVDCKIKETQFCFDMVTLGVYCCGWENGSVV